MSTPHHTHPQDPFFSLPTELRHAIFSHLLPNRLHISLNDTITATTTEKTLQFSPCVQRENDGDPNCFYRRSNHENLGVDHWRSDPAYVRRLSSAWGEHWRCEEVHEEGDETVAALLKVCKRMLVDVTEYIADTAAIHINDLDTLGTLIANPTTADNSVTSTFLACLLPNLKTLNISLRLPRATYTMLENAEQCAPSPVPAWTDLPLAIERLHQMKRLRIWLDHDDPCTWSVISERAILSPIISLHSIASLNVTINIPMLHPKYETPDQHFTPNSAPPTFTIQRRYRQRYHAMADRDGQLSPRHVPDFPVLHELHEMDEWGMTAEQMEEMERESWLRGEDPVQEYILIFEPQNGCGSI